MLKRPLSRSSNAEAADVLFAKRALAAAGLYAVPEAGITPYPDEEMFAGLKALQNRAGRSAATGDARPGDATDRALERIAGGARPNLLVHVGSYAQDRGGTATKVSEHTRAWPGQGGGDGGGKLPPMGSPVGREPKFRGRDGYGYGHYGARRKRPDAPYPEKKVVWITALM